MIAAPVNGCRSIELLLHACECRFSNSTEVIIQLYQDSGKLTLNNAVQAVKTCRLKAHLCQVLLDLLVACMVV